MPSLYAEIEINAPLKMVWQAIVQKEQWKYWNTFLYDCDASQPLEQGSEVLLSLRRLPGDEETEFQPRITLVHPPRCLKWQATIPGFSSEHVFELLDLGLGRTKYVHCQTLSGTLIRFLLPFIRRDEQQGMRRMAWELKQYAEGGCQPGRISRRRR